MKKTKIIGILMLVFTVYTIIGMAAADAGYWRIYNYVTLAFSVLSGIILLKD
jgi:hypothetical protein